MARIIGRSLFSALLNYIFGRYFKNQKTFCTIFYYICNKLFYMPDKELRENEKYPRTIPLELYEQWRKVQRAGDPALIAKKIKVSRQVVHYALTYGNVKTQFLSDSITKFFETRLLKELADAQRLSQLTKTDGTTITS